MTHLPRHVTDRMTPVPATTPATAIPVFHSDALRVVHGVNEGESLSFAEDLVIDDVYWFSPRSERLRLMIETREDLSMGVAANSPVGRPGAKIAVDSCLMLMSPDGATTELLVLVELGTDYAVNDIYAMPLAELAPKVDYQLVGVDRAQARRKFAQVGCVSFTRGTRITLASGEQRAIEDLRPGDRVLTRDDGGQPLRWIGQSTVRATGEFAPIVIRAGTLSNDEDLVVSPDHRLFIYQREDALGIGRHELLVRARHLVNGTSVHRQPGGFVDYFQLLFDRHQIIYAEGIAAETLLVDTRTRAALPPGIESELGLDAGTHGDRPHRHFEIQQAFVDRPDALALLRGASGRQLKSRDGD